MASLASCGSCCGGSELVGFNEIDYSIKTMLLAYSDSENMHNAKPNGKSFLVLSCAYSSDLKKLVKSTHQGIYYQHARNLQGATAEFAVERLEEFQEYIEEYDLGVVTLAEGPPALNPHMDGLTYVRSGLWVPDNRAVREFITKVKGWRQAEIMVSNGLRWAAI